MNNFLNISCDCIFMKGEETKEEPKKERVGSGMYHAVDLDEWDDPFPILTIGNKGRVHLPLGYLDSDIWVFISESADIREKCNLILLPKTGPTKWEEVFQSKGKNAGDLLNIFGNGDICVKYKKGMNVKIFVRK
jgi:hypothetical protein